MDALGVFIDGGRWDVAHLKSAFGRTRLAGGFTVSEGTVAERAGSVGDYMKRKGLPGALVSVALRDAATRVIEVPAGSETDLGPAIGFEIERHMPFAALDSEYCWTIAERKKGVFSVVVAIARKSAIDEVVGAFREAGCIEVSVVPRAAALSEALKANNEETDGACVFTKGEDVGYADFYEGAFPCSSVSLPSNTDPDKALEAAMANRSRRTGRATKRILCPGPMDLLSVSAPLKPLKPFEASSSPVAFGAALSILKDGPMFFRKKRRARTLLSSSTLWYAAAAFIALALFSLPLRDRYDLWRIDKKVSALAEERAASMAGTARLREAGRAIDALGRIKGETLARLDLLKALTEAAAGDTYLTSFESRADEVAFEGLSRDASAFFLKLEGSDALDKVELSGPITRSEGMERFRMKAKAAPYGRAGANG